MERLGSGWRRGGGYFGYQNNNNDKKKKMGVGGFGSLFLEFPSLLDSLVVCMCCCNPSPFPHVSLMYINSDSRGQCVLGEVKLLSSQSITFNLHSSACGPRSGREMCLAFPKTGCLLGVNQRDTHGPERP